MSTTASKPQGSAPPRAGLVLTALILVAAVANLNLSVANVALPAIGKHFDSGQTTLDHHAYRPVQLCRRFIPPEVIGDVPAGQSFSACRPQRP